MQAAVEAYMTKLAKESPDTVVGVGEILSKKERERERRERILFTLFLHSVTFNNDVTIIGDGSGTPVTVTGDKLGQFDTLLDIGRASTIR